MELALALAVIGVVLSAAAFASAPLPEAAPEEAGLSPERLGRVTAAVQAHVDAGRVAGAVMLVGRHGKVGYFEAIGMSDMEAGAPMERDTIFRIYSMTKPITSVALMTLWEEGAFGLDDAVGKFIPGLGGLQVAVEGEGGVKLVPAEREMTVRDLLRHTAGLAYGFDEGTHVERLYRAAGVLGSESLAEMVEKLSRLPLAYQPGARWQYSVSVDVQGRLIEILSGMRFDRFLEERIFRPLGMVDTAFWVTPDRVGRFAAVYRPDEDMVLHRSEEQISLGGPDYLTPAKLLSGGGGLVSSGPDYARFALMLLNGGELEGVRILKRNTLDLMTQDHLGDIPRDWLEGSGFGLGFSVQPDTGGDTVPSPGTFGWGGAAHTRLWVDPRKGFFGLWLVQIMPDNELPYGDEFQRLVYAALAD
jgi:CubicO group peptidase (beta-lactamase class C family)